MFANEPALARYDALFRTTSRASKVLAECKEVGATVDGYAVDRGYRGLVTSILAGPGGSMTVEAWRMFLG